MKIDDLTESKNNYIEEFVKFCSSATEVIHNQAINLWNSFWDDPVGNLTILGGIAISAGAAAATFGLSALVSAATWAAGISYTSAAAYSLKQISQGDDEEGITNLLRTVVSAFTAGLLNGMNVEVSSQTKLNFSAGSLALEQTQIPSVSISFSNDVAYDALMAQKVAEVNSGIATQNATINPNVDAENGKVEKPRYIVNNVVPEDEETILSSPEFQRTNRTFKGARIYKKDGKYYYRDTFHKGERAHLEVFDKFGNHLGEANPLTGELIPGTKDLLKKIIIK